jgi:hypothetical protein
LSAARIAADELSILSFGGVLMVAHAADNKKGTATSNVRGGIEVVIPRVNGR